MALNYLANVGRQWPLIGVFHLTGQSSQDGTSVSGVAIANAADLPNTYIVLRGGVMVLTAFDGTTNTITAGDSGSAARFLSAVDLKTAANTAFSGVPFYSATIGNMAIKQTWTGTPTSVGEAYVWFEYIIPGRTTEVQTN